MERGEDWEYEAVRDQWTTIERRRRVTKRLVAAFSLGLVAVVLFMLAVTPEACMYGRGSPNACDPVTSGPVFGVLVATGIAALGGGLGLCGSALNIHHRYSRDGC